MDIQVGEHTNNYAEIAAKDKLTELQLRVRQLVEQVDQIQKEQNYQRVSLSYVLAMLWTKSFNATSSVFVTEEPSEGTPELRQ